MYSVAFHKLNTYLENVKIWEDNKHIAILDRNPNTEGMTLVRVKDKHQFTDKQLKAVLDALIELEGYGNAIERSGADLAKFITLRHKKTKKLPIYMVKVEQITHFVFDDKELAELTKASEEGGLISSMDF
jgi:hypothetical protein